MGGTAVTAGSAGYAGTPLARKLGLKPGHRVVLEAAPAGWTIPEPPDGTQLVREAPGEVGTGAALAAAGPAAAQARADVVVAFFTEAAELVERLPVLGRRVFPDGAVWVAWPRRAAGHASDILEQTIRDVGLPLGLVDVKVAALDHDWSGLRLVWRRELRSADRPPPPR
jgi:hypothetical protein